MEKYEERWNSSGDFVMTIGVRHHFHDAFSLPSDVQVRMRPQLIDGKRRTGPLTLGLGLVIFFSFIDLLTFSFNLLLFLLITIIA